MNNGQTLSNVTWGDGVNGEALLAALKGTEEDRQLIKLVRRRRMLQRYWKAMGIILRDEGLCGYRRTASEQEQRAERSAHITRARAIQSPDWQQVTILLKIKTTPFQVQMRTQILS